MGPHFPELGITRFWCVLELQNKLNQSDHHKQRYRLFWKASSQLATFPDVPGTQLWVRQRLAECSPVSIFSPNYTAKQHLSTPLFLERDYKIWGSQRRIGRSDLTTVPSSTLLFLHLLARFRNVGDSKSPEDGTAWNPESFHGKPAEHLIGQ